MAFTDEPTLTRRAALMASAALPAWFLSAHRAEAAEQALGRPRRIGPNDQIHLAVIGPGGSRGGYRQGLNVTRHLASKAGVKVVAVCDVDQLHADEAAAQFGPETRKFRDYRELLALRDLDAVVIGTPDHWHARQMVDAMRAGRDVYGEKPMTLTIPEGRLVADTARKHKRVFQTGSQQRSDGRFRLAAELVRNGRLGRLTEVDVRLPGGPTGGPFEVRPVPEGFDYDLWLGPAPKRPYVPERTHGSFRWWRDYSGGMLTDWGAHHFDIVQWALGQDAGGPVAVSGVASNPPERGPNRYDTYPQFDVTFEYPGGLPVRARGQGENGILFKGERGELFVSRERIGASDPKLLEEPLGPDAVRLEVSDDHGQNFLDRVRDRKDPICHAEVGHRSVTVCHLANLCLDRGGERMRWDARREVAGAP